MGSSQSKPKTDYIPPQSSLIITGLATQWPECLIGPDTLEDYTRKWSDPNNNPSIARLLRMNRDSGIASRAVIDLGEDNLWNQPEPPSADDLDRIYRRHGVGLAVGACESALREWGGRVSDITHVVSVTATNTGSPGYDQLVALRLGIQADAERVLLSGVGCAGGLASLRVAANMCLAASHCGKAARVLVFATEICSTQIRCELEAACRTQEPCVGPALFGDGAAALILCNEYAPEASHQGSQHGVYSLLHWTTRLIPGTASEMAYRVTGLGFLLHLSRNVPQMAANAVRSQFNTVLCNRCEHRKDEAALDPQAFDWALHPGGKAIIKEVQSAMNLSDDQLRATHHIYRTRGNSSSVAVLAVLDKLRSMGKGRDDVFACSFGPGLAIEIASLRRLDR